MLINNNKIIPLKVFTDYSSLNSCFAQLQYVFLKTLTVKYGRSACVLILCTIVAGTVHTALFAQKIASGGDYSFAVCNDNTVRSWGFNNKGQLGDGTTTQRITPVQVSGLAGITNIADGGQHSLALKNDGTVWAWGEDADGQLGNGNPTNQSTTPVQVNTITGIIAIAGGGNEHSLALRNDGTVWSWGGNFSGQLGDGTTTKRVSPVQVGGLTGITSIACGDYHSLALKNDGTVWAWGRNTNGQLGDGTSGSPANDRWTPVQVIGLTGITAIAGGWYHSLALKNDGTVWVWGINNYGQLGDGTTTQKTTPVQVSGLTGITAIAGGWYHSLALKNDGTVWAWGRNNYGQLGNGTTTDSSTPIQVSGLTGITAIGGGWYHSLALKNDGTVWAWGSNLYGRLGDGTTTQRTAPVQVISLCTVSLPVELISFSGSSYGNEVKLIWSTATEINNDYFTIERSADEKNFQSTGNVDGAGNSAVQINYEFVDDTPLSSREKSGGEVYYRLRQTDYDGKFEYSSVISIVFKSENPVIANVYPDPAIDNIIVEIYTVQAMTAMLQITDLFGRNILNQEFFLTNNNTNNLPLDISSLSKGVYFLLITQRDGLENKVRTKFIKL